MSNEQNKTIPNVTSEDLSTLNRYAELTKGSPTYLRDFKESLVDMPCVAIAISFCPGTHQYIYDQTGFHLIALSDEDPTKGGPATRLDDEMKFDTLKGAQLMFNRLQAAGALPAGVTLLEGLIDWSLVDC